MTRADKRDESTTVRRSGDSGARRFAIAVAAAAALALVTGCGPTDPGPTGSPTASVSLTPSPTPTAPALAEPTKPPEMERDDEVGAVAAAEYFMELYGHVRQTGDAVGWDAISGQLCEFCAAISKAAVEVYGAGERIEGGLVEVGTGAIVRVDADLGTSVVQLDYVISSARRVDSAGALVAEYPSEEGWILLNVTPSTRGWVLLAGEYREESIS